MSRYFLVVLYNYNTPKSRHHKFSRDNFLRIEIINIFMLIHACSMAAKIEPTFFELNVICII